MKRILITGEGSYIGSMFTKWLEQWPGDYIVDEISVRGDEWKDADFSSYDTVFHVAGIAHRKETKENRDLYYEVNRDLAIETAIKAKEDGVRQFIFLSTMSVYGMETGVITKETKPDPKNTYGQSKLEAEQIINKLDSKFFRVVVLRPPMVYGEKSPGNYQLLIKFAKMSPIFPDYKNKRSMIYINTLSEFVRQIITGKDRGLFHPQDDQYMRTTNMIKNIAKNNNEKIKLIKIFNPFIKLALFLNISTVNKVFGDLIYVKGELDS